MNADPALLGPFVLLLVLSLLGDGLRPGRDGIPALVAFGAAGFAACANQLEGCAAALAILMVATLGLRWRAGIPPRGLAAQGAVLAASMVALGLGLKGRFSNAGGGHGVEWIGTPFVGDTPSSWIFAGLALPLMVPGALGGAAAGFDRAAGSPNGGALRAMGRPSATALAAAGTLLPMALAVALFRTFAGSPPLAAVGSIAALGALLEAVAAGRFRLPAALRALTAGSIGLQLVALAEASSAGEDAFRLGMLALALGAGGAIVSVARLAAGPAGDVPTGGGPTVLRAAPVGSVLAAVSIGSLGAVPLTLGFAARARTLGTAAGDLPQESLLAAALQGPLFALCALPLLVHVLRSSASRTGDGGGARLALGIAAAATVVLGAAPEAALAWLGHGEGRAPAALFPGAVGQLSLLMASATMALLAWRRVGPRSELAPEPADDGDQSRSSGAILPRHEAERTLRT